MWIKFRPGTEVTMTAPSGEVVKVVCVRDKGHKLSLMTQTPPEWTTEQARGPKLCWHCHKRAAAENQILCDGCLLDAATKLASVVTVRIGAEPTP